MALSDLQKAVLQVISANRSETSYLAGGAVLNWDWSRRSDDLDIFHDTDEEIGASADKDIKSLQDAGFKVSVDIRIYGMVEATISREGSSTVLQWMSEARRLFFPLIRDAECGVRLHQADLAVNKLIAASSRFKARDLADLLAIETYYCHLAPLALAAAGKPPHLSPQRTLEEVLRRVTGMPDEEFQAVRGLPADWTPQFIRSGLKVALEKAEADLSKTSAELTGCLVINQHQRPTLFTAGMERSALTLRRAVEKAEPIPQINDGTISFLPD